jgi:hypothetical protein
MNVLVKTQTRLGSLQCSQCGARASAACACGVPYVRPGVLIRRALEETPERSDSAIAADLGVNQTTVSRIRRST